jgi:zinc/manganese transport system substrate-binding protein
MHTMFRSKACSVPLAVCLLALLAGARAAPAGDPLEVVTTLNVLADVAREIGGDLVHAQSLADARQDPHTVEPRPTLMQVARKADVFVEIGLQLELWGEKVVSGSGNTKIQRGQPGRIVASTGVRTLELPQVLSREWGDVHPYGNPHIWLDPIQVKHIAENIARGLEAVDAAHAEVYRTRLKAYEDRIDRALFGPELVEEVGGAKLSRLAEQDRLSEYLEQHKLADKLGGWLKRAAPLKGRPIVTYHKTAIYAAQRFGFTIPIEIEEKPGIPPSARHRDHVLEVMKAQGVRTILQAVYYDRAAGEYLASKTGAHLIVIPIDVGTEEAPTYFDLIDLMLSSLVASETTQAAAPAER